MKPTHREIAIAKIANLRKSEGSGVFDFANIFRFRPEELRSYLEDNVTLPLQRGLDQACRNGFDFVKYALYSAYDRSGKLIIYDFTERAPISIGRVPEGIEVGVNRTIEQHITNPKALELMLYVKAVHGELTFMPEDILEDELAFV